MILTYNQTLRRITLLTKLIVIQLSKKQLVSVKPFLPIPDHLYQVRNSRSCTFKMHYNCILRKQPPSKFSLSPGLGI